MALPATPILPTLKAPERNLRSGAFARETRFWPAFAWNHFFLTADGDKIQILSAAGFHGFSVAHRIFVFLRQPVGPDRLVALHLLNGEDFCAAASALAMPVQ